MPPVSRIFTTLIPTVPVVPAASPSPTTKDPAPLSTPPLPPAGGGGGSSTTHRSSGGDGVQAFANRGQEPAAQRQRRLFNALLAGEEPAAAAADLQALQRLALDTIQATFTNAFGTDGELKHQVGLKQADFARLGVAAAPPAVFGRRQPRDQQLDSLVFLLRTFRDPGEADTALRRTIFAKLAELGRQQDLAAILPYARHGTPSDLHHALNCLQAIANREGSPQPRGTLKDDPELGPLLARERLTADEERRVIEAVLQRGTIAGVKRHRGTNRNDVYFVTFAEGLPDGRGGRRPIRGVFKPERVYFGKDRAFFTREVAAYEFDKQFAKTGLVPPTVEGLADVGHGLELGSIQFMVPDSRPLGSSVLDYDRHFDAFRRTERFKEQERKLRTLLYIFSDPDKLPNNVIGTPNLQNILIDERERLWMIDNAYAMGAPPQEVSSAILPPPKSVTLSEELAAATGLRTRALMQVFISHQDAKRVAERTAKAVAKLKG